MELWFIAAVTAAVLAGFSNFCFKIAARRNYDSELFTLIGGVTSVLLVSLILWLSDEAFFEYGYIAWITALAGVVAATGGIMKVYALQYIDTTIFFPLFKLIAPALAIGYGLIFFAESHTTNEWIGLLLGLTVPLLLINNVEQARQKNLLLGLLFPINTPSRKSGDAGSSHVTE